MTTLLRLLAILALLAVALLVLAAAFAVTVNLAQLPIDLDAVLGDEKLEVVAGIGWLEAALWGAGGLFFLIAAIRLMRRTQGWFLWLCGFACLAGRWVLSQGGPDASLAVVRKIDPGLYLQPAALDIYGSEVQVGRFGVLLLLGLIVLIVDIADRSHWKRQEG